MMYNDDVRTKQFNMRMTEAELATLSLLAAQNGTTPSEFLRFLLRQAADGTRKPRLATVHHDVLTQMAMDPKTPMGALDLLQVLRNRENDAWFGKRLYQALIELEHLGYVVRAPNTVASYLITPAGQEQAKHR